ncbi:MAG: TIGR00282 family metallophosphoesterase [Alphaproteobacteria bacterium]
MKILFIGDIMGRSGREALEKHLPELKKALQPDVTIINGENAASGAGITGKQCKEFYELGVDCITTGNHVWDQREIIPYIGNDPKLIRPMNYPENTPGKGFYKYQLADGRKIIILNAMCRLFMDPLDDPFAGMREFLKTEKLGQTTNAIFVDLHGEATSEKMSFGHHFAGQVSAVIGTHTHIPTADAHIMKGGTAYMSDAGMTGDYDSVIGVEKGMAIHRFVKRMPGERFQPAKGPGTLCGCYIETDDRSGLATRIEPVRVGGILSPARPGL